MPLAWQGSVWLASNMWDIYCIIQSLMHIFPVCCIDPSIASLSIGLLQYSRPMCPSLKASCKIQTSFLYPLWEQIFNSGSYSLRDSLLAPSTYSLLDLLTSRVILQLTLLSAPPLFLCIPVFLVHYSVLDGLGSNFVSKDNRI